jgi:Ner family transcriptional regulator
MALEHISPDEIRKSMDISPAYLIAMLHERGLSLRQIARQNDCAPTTLSACLRVPYPRAEKLIAAALGVRVEDLWPVRVERRRLRAKRLGKRA